MKNLNTYIRDDFHGTPTGWNTWWDEEFNADYFSWQWPLGSGNYVVYDNEESVAYQILSPKIFPISGDCVIEWELYTIEALYEPEQYGIFLMDTLDREIVRISTLFNIQPSLEIWSHSGSIQYARLMTFFPATKYKYKIERVNGVFTGYYYSDFFEVWVPMPNPLLNNFDDFYVKIECGYWQNFNYFDFKAESGFPYLTHPNQVSRTKVAREGDILMGL